MAMEKLYNHDSAKSIVGISRTENQNPSFLFKIDENSRLSRYENSVPIPTQRQLINEIYYVEGSLYISEISHFNTCNTFYHENTIGYVLPKWKAIEIDDNYDFIMVEALLKKRGDFEFSKKIT
jgi:N-acylneuraminate cytidylyltransferase/CMP-N,N'-diacetyllegionaminic acid synthase